MAGHDDDSASEASDSSHCSHCDEVVQGDDVVREECIANHCDELVRVHGHCRASQEPLLCDRHLLVHRARSKARWAIGIGSGLLLVTGLVAAGYSSASLANALWSYFSYDPVTLMPHRLQVLVHTLGWLGLSGVAVTAIERSVTTRRTKALGRLGCLPDARGASPDHEAAPAAPVVHHYHHQSSDSYFPWLFWGRSASPQVVVHNHHGAAAATGTDPARRTKEERANHVPSNVTPYEPPGWMTWTVLLGGGAFGVYKLWSLLYARGCQHWKADLTL